MDKRPELTREQLELIDDNTSDLVFLIAVEGPGNYQVAYVEAARLSRAGIRAEDLVGLDLDQLLGPEDAEYVRSHYDRAIDARGPYAFETRARLREDTIHLDTTLVPALDVDGRCTHLIGVSREITGNRRERQALAAAAPARHDEAQEPEPVTAPRRILWVDDDPQIRALAGSYLRALGHDGDVVEGGRQALDRLDRGEYAVVITDVGMPGMSGLDLARHIAARAAPQPPVIAVTGWGDTISDGGRLPEGVAAVMAKPVGLKQIRDALIDLPARADR